MRTGTGITRGRWVQELMTLAARLALGSRNTENGHLFPKLQSYPLVIFLVSVRVGNAQVIWDGHQGFRAGTSGFECFSCCGNFSTPKASFQNLLYRIDDEGRSSIR
jgi:hypothetical protein